MIRVRVYRAQVPQQASLVYKPLLEDLDCASEENNCHHQSWREEHSGSVWTLLLCTASEGSLPRKPTGASRLAERM